MPKPGRPHLSDYGKLIVILAILTAMTTLAAFGRVSADSAVAMYLVVLGYVTGNGVLALRRRPPSPLVTSKTTAAALELLRSTAAAGEGPSSSSSDSPPSSSSSAPTEAGPL